MKITDAVNRDYEAAFAELIEKHRIAAKELDERQLADVIKQMIASGDIYKLIAPNGQQFVYLPFAEVERLKERIRDLEERCENNGVNPYAPYVAN